MLLKAAEFEESAARKKAFNLNDIEAEAEAIVARARREYQEILAEAQEELSRLRQQAQEKGYREGYDQGNIKGNEEGLKQALEQAKQEFTQRSDLLLSTMQRHDEQFDKKKTELLFQAEQNIVALAIEVARKVIKKAGLIHSAVAEANVKAALELASKTSDLVIRVNQQDMDHLKKMVEGAGDIIGKNRHISFLADESVEPGGCVLVSAQGEVDGQLETQINRITDELLMQKTNTNDKATLDESGSE